MSPEHPVGSVNPLTVFRSLYDRNGRKMGQIDDPLFTSISPAIERGEIQVAGVWVSSSRRVLIGDKKRDPRTGAETGDSEKSRYFDGSVNDPAL